MKTLSKKLVLLALASVALISASDHPINDNIVADIIAGTNSWTPY